jgi:serine/threonine-protein kinase RsbT
MSEVVMPEETLVSINGEADIVAARQQCRRMAVDMGFTETDQTLIATAVSEIARNIVTYAGRGSMTIDVMRDRSGTGLRIQAVDRGPGIVNIDQALQDGYSTGNTLGMGLPGARRLMDDFEVTSTPGEGTTVTMTKWLKPAPTRTHP